MNGSALFFVPTLLPSEKGKAKMNQNELCGYQRKAVPLPPKISGACRKSRTKYAEEIHDLVVCGRDCSRAGYSDCSGGIGIGALCVGVLA